MIAFALTCLLIELTPGPNMATVAALALAYGRAAGLAAVAGVALGLALSGLAAAFGLAALIQEVPAVFAVLRYAGSAYLLWLAYDAWRNADEAEEGVEAGRTLSSLFVTGLMTNLLNPKAFVFYLAILPGFIVPRPEGVIGQTLALIAIYVAIATAIHTAIVLAAGAARSALAAGPGLVRVRRVLAVLLAGVAVWMFIATRPT